MSQLEQVPWPRCSDVPAGQRGRVYIARATSQARRHIVEALRASPSDRYGQERGESEYNAVQAGEPRSCACRGTREQAGEHGKQQMGDRLRASKAGAGTRAWLWWPVAGTSGACASSGCGAGHESQKCDPNPYPTVRYPYPQPMRVPTTRALH